MIRNQLTNIFLDEKNITSSQRKKYIEECEKTISNIRDLDLSYKKINLADVIKNRLLGYDTNLSNAIKGTIIHNRIKAKIFLSLVYLRNLHIYKYLDSKKPRDNYEINLIDCEASKEKPVKKKIDLAFVCTDPGYIKTFMKIFHILEKKKKTFLVILPLKAKKWGHIDRMNRMKHCEIAFIEDFLDSNMKKELEMNLMQYYDFYEESKDKIKKAFSTDEYDLFNYFQPNLKKIFTRYFPQIISYLQISEKIFSNYDVKTLVGGKMRRYAEKAFFLMASNMKIKTISILPVLVTEDLESYYDQGDFSIADEIIVWDGYQKSIVEERKGNAKPKIMVYGNPQWEEYPSKEKRSRLRRGLKIKSKEKFVAITTQTIWPVKNVENIINICKNLGVKCVIKIHPNETKAKYKAIGAYKVVDDKNAELYPLMAEASAVITSHSTTAAEAMILGTNAIAYNEYYLRTISVDAVLEMYSRLGILCIDDKSSLKKALKDIINGKIRAPEKRKLNAGERVTEHILKS